MNEQQQSINPKTGIQEIRRIEKSLVDSGFLGEALLDTKEFLNTFHNAALENRLEKIDNDYTLMRDFLSKGYRDEKRDTLYQSLIGNLYRLLQDVVLEYEKVHNPMLFPHLQYQSTLSFDVDSDQAESMIRVAKHWLDQQKNGNGEWSRMRDEAKAALTCYMSNQVAGVGTAEMWENDFNLTTPEHWFDLPAQECEGLHWLNDAHFLTEVEWDIDLQEWVVA